MALVHPFQARRAGEEDAFILSLKPDGTEILFSSYLGGKSRDLGAGIATDRAGHVYVAGSTYSEDFPTVNAFQAQYNDHVDVFITKIDPSVPRITYSSYLGGSSDEQGLGLAVTSRGKAIVVGYTNSEDFPTKNELFRHQGRSTDAFIAKISSKGGLLFSTYMGGNGTDIATGVELDINNNIYVTGLVKSTDFPLVEPLQKKLSKGKTLAQDVFLTKLSRNASTILFSSYIGGAEDDWGTSLTVDRIGNVYISGETGSTDFPVEHAFQPTLAGKQFSDLDLFITIIANTQ